MQISTREELINALMDGAELEHNLACMYLFAAFSLKSIKSELNGIPEAEQDSVLDNFLSPWNDQLRKIAMQEMGHLGTVCNLLTLLGSEAHFDRPNFPPPDGYYPPSAKITLERFGLPALQRFVEFERNASSPGARAMGLAPKSVSYQHVGELYAAVLAAFEEPDAGGIGIPNDRLFLGFSKAMDAQWPGSIVEVHDFGLGNTPPVAIDQLRTKVREALFDVIEEGEGSQAPGNESHYQVFFNMADDLRTLLTRYPTFDPARFVSENPMVQAHRGSGSNVNLITASPAKEVAELFNSFYGTMLIALRQMYAFSENLGDGARRASMHTVGLQLMKRCVGPIGSALTLLPIANSSTQVAGPGFELYRPLYVTDRPQVAWKVVAERLELASAECTLLAASGSLPAEIVGLLNFAQTTADSLKSRALALAP